MRQVARNCYLIGEKVFGFGETQLKRIYILGYLHDIGYAFDPDNHAESAGEVLETLGYLDSEIIRMHGDSNPPIFPEELIVLNIADMTSGPKGGIVTFDNRLDDIAYRYGKESKQYKDAYKLAGKLKEKLKERSKDEIDVYVALRNGELY